MRLRRKTRPTTPRILLPLSITLFILGAALDTYTTTAFLFTTPALGELNPIIRFTYKTGGAPAIILLKAIIGVVSYVIFRRETTDLYLITAFTTIGGLWLLAGVWNSYLFFQL